MSNAWLLFCLLRPLDTLPLSDGMKPLAVQRVVRHLEQPLDLKYGIQPPAIPQQELQPLGVIRLAMQRPATVALRPVPGRIDGMRPPKQKEVFDRILTLDCVTSKLLAGDCLHFCVLSGLPQCADDEQSWVLILSLGLNLKKEKKIISLNWYFL